MLLITILILIGSWRTVAQMNITKILPILLHNYAMNHTFYRFLSANKSTQDVGGARGFNILLPQIKRNLKSQAATEMLSVQSFRK